VDWEGFEAISMASALDPDVSPYQYQPLDRSKDQIRLVMLIPSEDTKSPAQYVIRLFDVYNAPPFCALSYTWGQPTPTSVILIDGQPLTIRENLYKFLEVFRGQGGKQEHLWIDQICIDQSNILERNHQVQFMNRIYSSSAYVIIWLGDGSGTHNGQTYCQHAQRFNRSSRNDQAAAESLGALLHNDYFRRIWIVQEVLLARNIKVLVKTIWISWKRMIQIPDLMRKTWLIDAPKRWSATLLLRESLNKPQTRKLEDLISAFGSNICEDPRDKVYGFMGLVAPDDRLTIDYGKSVHQVFIELVLMICTACHDAVPCPNCSDHHNYGPHWSDQWDFLSAFAFDMGLTLSQVNSLSYFFASIWQPDRLDRFVGRPLPITAMGFEPADVGGRTDRWWYEFKSKSYYFDCVSPTFDRETNPLLFEDWAIVPMNEKRQESAEEEPATGYYSDTTDQATSSPVPQPGNVDDHVCQ
jgi:hypothetical protein